MTALSDPDVAPQVNGGTRLSRSDAMIDVVNPSNGRSSYSLPVGAAADVDFAVAAAKAAFEKGRWSEEGPTAKKATLHRFADLIAARADELDAMDAADMGKPVGLELFDARAASELMRFFAEAVDKVMGDVYAADRASFVAQRRVPRGVIAAVIPWNFPTFNFVLKCAPALAAGNSIVIKPSELSSRSAVALAKISAEAGLPPGVLNVVPGLGEIVGQALALHDDVDLLTFTGSTEVGKLMLHYASLSNMKPIIAECGGKSPHIVFADGVNIDQASDTIAQRIITNQGQICSVGSRLLVEQSIEQDMVARIAARLKDIRIGDASQPHTNFGPLASAKQRDRVMAYIDGAESEGARLTCGGRSALRESGGFFVEPTIFSAVPHSARIAQEEIFGPVLSVISFADENEAVRLANGTIYGLSATVWTADLSRAMRMMKALRSSVRINSAPPLGEGPGHAFTSEPAKQSGIGAEGGLAGLETYLRRQTVWISHACSSDERT